jgi:hypothetical protein
MAMLAEVRQWVRVRSCCGRLRHDKVDTADGLLAPLTFHMVKESTSPPLSRRRRHRVRKPSTSLPGFTA